MSYRDTAPGAEELWDDEGNVYLRAFDPVGKGPDLRVAIHVSDGSGLIESLDCAHPDALEAFGLKLVHKARLLRGMQGRQSESDDAFLDSLRARAELRRTTGGESR